MGRSDLFRQATGDKNPSGLVGEHVYKFIDNMMTNSRRLPRAFGIIFVDLTRGIQNTAMIETTVGVFRRVLER